MRKQFGDMLWQAMKNDGKTPSHDIYEMVIRQLFLNIWIVII